MRLLHYINQLFAVRLTADEIIHLTIVQIRAM